MVNELITCWTAPNVGFSQNIVYYFVIFSVCLMKIWPEKIDSSIIEYKAFEEVDK